MIGPARSLHNIHYQTHAGGGVPSISRRFFAPLAAIFLLLGCSPERTPPTTAPAPSGPTPAAAPSGPSAPIAPTGPVRLPSIVAEARLPPATVTPLDLAGTTVDPNGTFELRSQLPLRAARLVLLDAQDAMVPATVDSEIGTSSRFTLVPLEPLRPGSRYLLRLEGLVSQALQGGDGSTFEPVAFPLLTSGEPPQKPPPKKSSKKRSR